MLSWEVIEHNEVIAVFRNRDDAITFIEGCGNSRMKLRQGKWVQAE